LSVSCATTHHVNFDFQQNNNLLHVECILAHFVVRNRKKEKEKKHEQLSKLKEHKRFGRRLHKQQETSTKRNNLASSTLKSLQYYNKKLYEATNSYSLIH
jgi:hypothetical protein